ncbi:MAG TPA: response regulator [Candidatus Deferrimicrobium sp.]|nr:response regulator [Candidatus Deferrimicrobium sp.]
MALKLNQLLIIDDDVQICNTLSDILEESGYKVSISITGQDAVNKIKNTEFNVALIDLLLPDMDGITLLRTLKHIYPDIICIIITGNAILDKAVKALTDGADGFFIKPVIVDELLQKIQEESEKQFLRRALKKSEEKYRIAYTHSEFYRDLLCHDIANILQSISLSAEISLSVLNEPENLGKELVQMEEYIQRAAKLISNVQKLSHLEGDKLVLESVELCNLLKKAITFIKKSFEWREIKIQIDSPKTAHSVKANSLLIDEFENILHNACKYNQGPVIEILIRISEIERNEINYIQLEFIDNGIGVPDNKKEEIFQRSDKENNNGEGMGLGLSLVKKITETYNGQIWVEDKVRGDYSKGSNFVLLIPEAVK